MSAATEDGASDPVEWCSLASTISIAIGIVLIAFGLLVPTNYTFDANLPARQMESIEVFYFRLSEGLVISLICGMALVTVGGVIQTGIILHMYWHGELDPRPPRSSERNRGSEMTALWQGPSEGRTYGTRERPLGDPPLGDRPLGERPLGNAGTSGARDGTWNDATKTPVQESLEGESHSGDVSQLQHQQPR